MTQIEPIINGPTREEMNASHAKVIYQHGFQESSLRNSRTPTTMTDMVPDHQHNGKVANKNILKQASFDIPKQNKGSVKGVTFENEI